MMTLALIGIGCGDPGQLTRAAIDAAERTLVSQAVGLELYALQKILLQAELLELRANPDRPAEGTVIEAMVAPSHPSIGERLADIPFLGNLFKNKSRKKDKAELLIFLTPKVMRVAKRS
mgnify:CR=1 FL=1